MKEKMLKKVLSKEMKLHEIAEIFGVIRQSASKWLAKYKYAGMSELSAKKIRSQEWNLLGTKLLMKLKIELLKSLKNIFLRVRIGFQMSYLTKESTSMSRRKTCYYYTNYKHKKRKKKLYCLGFPGRETQLDCCFPWRHQRKLVRLMIARVGLWKKCIKIIQQRAQLRFKGNGSI